MNGKILLDTNIVIAIFANDAYSDNCEDKKKEYSLSLWLNK